MRNTNANDLSDCRAAAARIESAAREKDSSMIACVIADEAARKAERDRRANRKPRQL